MEPIFDDVLTYLAAVDLHSRGEITKEDLQIILDTLSDPGEMLTAMGAVFLGTLDSLDVAWESVRDAWLQADVSKPE